jgi:putative transposase
MKRRKFTKEQKLEIIHYAEEHGSTEACRRYGLSGSLFYRWRSQYETKGLDGLENRYKPRQDGRVNDLERENSRLKKIIAEQALELDLAKEMIKKKYQQKWK